MLCKQRNATERNIITSKYIYETNCTLIFNEHDEEDEEQEGEEDNDKTEEKLSQNCQLQFQHNLITIHAKQKYVICLLTFLALPD